MKKYMSLGEVAQAAGVSYTKVWYYLISGRLPEPERVGRCRVFSEDDLAVVKQFFNTAKRPRDNADGPVNY